MAVKLLTEHHLEFLSLKETSQARLSLHLSKCHIVGNHMPRLIYMRFRPEIVRNCQNYPTRTLVVSLVTETTRPGCPPVREDNPRALASGLSYVQADKPVA